MKRIIGIFILAVFIGATAFLIYLFNGFTDKKSIIEYEVSINDPASGRMDVVMTLYPKKQLFQHLYMSDIKANNNDRVHNLQIKRNKTEVKSWQTIPWFKDMKSIWLGFNDDPITISYSVDAAWYRDDVPRSYIGSDYAFLKGITFLYVPLTSSDTWALIRGTASGNDTAGLATIDFRTPEGWNINSPWGAGKQEIPASFIGNVYFSLGNISTQTSSLKNDKDITIKDEDMPISIGIYNKIDSTEKSKLQKNIPDLYKQMYKALGFFPKSPASYWAVTVFPDSVIHGDAVGTSSLITGNDIAAISHEMFHWWNGSTIQVFEDADWIKEGFSEYYGNKMLSRAGIISSGDFIENMKNYSNKLWGDGASPQPINFVNASKRFVADENQKDYDAVNYGGTLIAYYLDTQLQKMEVPQADGQKKKGNAQKQFKSLDMIWKTIAEEGLLLTTDKFISELEKLGGEKLSKECSDIVYGRKAIELPKEK